MPKNILIVENEKPVARALELKLHHNTFNTKTAYDGKEALQMLAKEKFNLILLDLVMPNVDGFAFLTQLKPEIKDVPIIVISNLGLPEDIKRAKDLGVREYFVKSETSIKKIVEYITNMLK